MKGLEKNTYILICSQAGKCVLCRCLCQLKGSIITERFNNHRSLKYLTFVRGRGIITLGGGGGVGVGEGVGGPYTIGLGVGLGVPSSSSTSSTSSSISNSSSRSSSGNSSGTSSSAEIEGFEVVNYCSVESRSCFICPVHL